MRSVSEWHAYTRRARTHGGWHRAIDWNVAAACGPSLTLGLWAGWLFVQACSEVGTLVWRALQ
jgi:hypothetical protein